MKNTYVAPQTDIVILCDNDILLSSGLFKSHSENGELSIFDWEGLGIN